MVKDDLRKLISQREGLTLDFKKDLNADAFPDLPKDLAAFANSEGGTIVVGIDDGGHVVGVEWNETKSQQVHQAGAKCKPPIPVRVTEDSFRKKRVAYIEIQKSTAIHSDDRDRFPQRFADQTVFMDARTIILLATVRGLIAAQAPTARPALPRKKPSETELYLANNLKSSSGIVRAMSLQDLGSLAYRVNVEKIPGLFQMIINCLTHIDGSVRLAALDLSERILFRMDPRQRRKYSSGLVPTIRSLAQPGNDLNIRARALYLLSLLGRKEALIAIVELVAKEPDESYQRIININNVVPQVIGTGLGHHLRALVYRELSKNEDPKIVTRLTQLLEALRNVYWPE